LSPPCAEALFWQGRFWHAHEAWEEQWQASGDDYYKGLIQLAAALFHLRRRNERGAARLLRTSQEYLALRGESPWRDLARALADGDRPLDLNLDALVTLYSSTGLVGKPARRHSRSINKEAE
jgi:hypothetical protein